MTREPYILPQPLLAWSTTGTSARPFTLLLLDVTLGSTISKAYHFNGDFSKIYFVSHKATEQTTRLRLTEDYKLVISELLSIQMK